MIDSLTASDDAQTLHISWASGEETSLPASTLRRKARDAWTRREEIDFGSVRVEPGIRITALKHVGAGGVNVHFSDGHDKAIYPFEYLRALSNSFDN